MYLLKITDSIHGDIIDKEKVIQADQIHMYLFRVTLQDLADQDLKGVGAVAHADRLYLRIA